MDTRFGILVETKLQQPSTMQAEIHFDKELHTFISMAIQIWPTFQSGLRHLQEISSPQEGSYMPQRNYSNMSAEQFTKVIVQDLFEFIMTHDVNENDLCDYLSDILELLMMEEQLIGGSMNPASIEYMSAYTFKVIQQLQNGCNDRVKSFQQDVYLNVKQFKGQIVEDKNNSNNSDEQEEQSEQDSEQSYDSEEQQKERQKKQAQDEKTKNQKELQDDGWIIVKKK